MNWACVSCVYYRGHWCSRHAKEVKPHLRCSAFCNDPAEARAVQIPERMRITACKFCRHNEPGKFGEPDVDYCTMMGGFIREPVYSCSVEDRNWTAYRRAQEQLEAEKFPASCGACKNLRFYVEATGKFVCSKRVGQWETSDIDARWDCSDFSPGATKRQTGCVQRTIVRVSCVPGGV